MPSYVDIFFNYGFYEYTYFSYKLLNGKMQYILPIMQNE